MQAVNYRVWKCSWVLECNCLYCLIVKNGLWHNFNLCQLANPYNSLAWFGNSHEQGLLPAGNVKLSCFQIEIFFKNIILHQIASVPGNVPEHIL